MKLKLTICGLIILLILVITVSYYTNKEGFENQDTIIKFETVGTTTWTAPVGVSNIAILVVAGGGGGGSGASRAGGGGGGGGVIYKERYSVTEGNT